MMDPEQLIERHPAVMVLFGGPDCGVCHAIRPKLEALVAKAFPKMQFAYIDCADDPAACARHMVFTVPVVKVWLDGRLAGEWARAFSVEAIRQALERPYELLFS
ncbi:MAG: thioredoxin [Bacteroidetes bacterium]|nr:MAG: thioredoxin [Bacteroidota bacterium]